DRRGGRRRRRGNAGAPRTARPAAPLGNGRRGDGKVGDDGGNGGEDGAGRDADRHGSGAASDQREACHAYDGDRATSGECARDHAAGRGSIGAKVPSFDKSLSRNVLANLVGAAGRSVVRSGRQILHAREDSLGLAPTTKCYPDAADASDRSDRLVDGSESMMLMLAGLITFWDGTS